MNQIEQNKRVVIVFVSEINWLKYFQSFEVKIRSEAENLVKVSFAEMEFKYALFG
jgi:hypothetical protein